MPAPFEFRIEPVAYRIIDTSTVSLERAVVESNGERFSVFRKRIRARREPPAGREDLPLLIDGHERRDHWTHWRREIEFYGSEFRARLNGELRAPHCHAIEGEGETATLWLQDFAGRPAREWDVARFGRAMRALGEFQARAALALPDEPWLSRGTARAELTRRPAFAGDAETIDRLERLPQTVCHFDLWSANLFAGATAEHDDATYAIDWSNVGIGPFGYDVANTVFDSVWMCDVRPELLDDLVPAAIRHYLTGIRDAGFAVDEAAVGRTYADVAWLKFARLEPRLASAEADASRHDTIAAMYRMPASRVFEHRRATIAAAERLYAAFGSGRGR